MKIQSLFSFLLIAHLTAVKSAQQNVTLTSTLPEDLVVLPGTDLVFTCTVRGARILQWSSAEYISDSGHNIQILDSSSGRDVMRGEAHATLVSATTEDGVPVLVSELRITVSSQYPVATIQCDDNGHGSVHSITFVRQNVTLSSTLPDDLVAYSGQELVFTCTVRGARILQWSSAEYISDSGHNIQILDSSSGMDVMRGEAHATLISATTEDGVPVLVSELRITVSSRYPVATIQCDDNGHGSNDNITFLLTDSPLPIINTFSLREEIFACPGDIVQFECVTIDSQSLAWMSEYYIGSRATVPFSYGSPINIREESPGINFAMLMNTSRETGRIQLTSMLSITVLESIKDQSHSVTCLNVDIQTTTTVSFQLAESCEDTTTIMSTESDMKLGKKSNNQHKILLGVLIPVGTAIIIVVIIIVALCVRKPKQSGKVKPCSCISSDQGESQHSQQLKTKEPAQVPLPQVQVTYVPSTSTSTSRSTLSEQKSLLKSPSTLTADSMKSGQLPIVMSKITEASEEDNASTEATSIGDIHMQDNASNVTASTKDLHASAQDITSPCEAKE